MKTKETSGNVPAWKKCRMMKTAEKEILQKYLKHDIHTQWLCRVRILYAIPTIAPILPLLNAKCVT